jgi:hypothetical protein
MNNLTVEEKKVLSYLITKQWGELEFNYPDKEKAKQGQDILLSIKSKLLEN